MRGGVQTEEFERGSQRRQRIVAIHRQGECGLRKLCSRVIEYERQVYVARSRQSEQLLQADLTGRRVEQVGAADDFGDVCIGIVDDYSKLIGKAPFDPANDKIAHVAQQILREVAVQQ